jgi:DNA-binding NarL/FixJ family response regulator
VTSGPRVLVLDAHETVLWGLRFVLVSRGVARRCLLSTSVLEAISLATRYDAQVAIVGDVPPVAPADAVAALRRARPGLQVLQLVAHGSAPSAAALRRPRDASVDDIAETVARLAGQPAPARETLAAELSGRQREVLAGLAAGMTNQEIADCIGLSPDTVKWHVRSLCRRLGARNRAEVVARALSLDAPPDVRRSPAPAP